jgi:hypothetical protein
MNDLRRLIEVTVEDDRLLHGDDPAVDLMAFLLQFDRLLPHAVGLQGGFRVIEVRDRTREIE